MKNKYTILGVLAIAIWGLSAGFTRTLGESLGLFTSGALVNILAGVLICIFMRIRYGNWGGIQGTPLKYLLICGLLYLIYVFTSYISTIAAQDRQQVLSIVIVKFMWPIFTLLLTIPILKQRPSRWIWASVSLSLLGLVLINYDVGSAGTSSLASGFSVAAALPLILGLISAASWALFSVYIRKLHEHTKQDFDYVGYFILLAGVLMGIVALFRAEPHQFGLQQMGELFFQVVLTSCCATLFWNLALRKGNIVLVVTLSNILPVISVLGTAIILQEPITAPILIGAALISVSTVWSRWCFKHGATEAAFEETPND